MRKIHARNQNSDQITQSPCDRWPDRWLSFLNWRSDNLLTVECPPCGSSSQPRSAAERLSEPGPEHRALEAQVGRWNVTSTIWPAPGAAPIVSSGLIAERTMIGPYLQEIMRPAPGSTIPDFHRIDYLNFDRVEGRWKYVSLDTRMPVSIMPAWSFGPARDGRIELLFQPQAFVGFGADVEGRFMVSDMVITRQGPDRELKQQHVVIADGTGRSWLMVEYQYTRATPGER